MHKHNYPSCIFFQKSGGRFRDSCLCVHLVHTWINDLFPPDTDLKSTSADRMDGRHQNDQISRSSVSYMGRGTNNWCIHTMEFAWLSSSLEGSIRRIFMSWSSSRKPKQSEAGTLVSKEGRDLGRVDVGQWIDSKHGWRQSAACRDATHCGCLVYGF